MNLRRKHHAFKWIVMLFLGSILLFFTVVNLGNGHAQMTMNAVHKDDILLEKAYQRSSVFFKQGLQKQGAVGPFSPHDPIVINGDADFAAKAQAEGWSGDGSSSNPYIIENYVITVDATSGQGPFRGISVQATTVHFIIRNIKINATSSGNNIPYGLYLENVANGIIANDTFDKSLRYSISLIKSQGITIKNNEVLGTTGVWAIGSSNNVVENNLFDNSSISLDHDSNRNILRGNVFKSHRSVAIVLGGSGGSFVADNQIINNTFLDTNQAITMNNVSNILVMHNRFQNSISYAVIVSVVSGAVVENVNVTITGNLFINATNQGAISIWVSGLRDSIISNNIFRDNAHGSILMDENSSNNTIMGNIFENITSHDVIEIRSSSGNVIQNNTIQNFERGGIYLLDGASHNLILNNTLSSSKTDLGISISDSSNGNQLLNNTIRQMKGYAVWIGESVRDTYIKWNDFIENNGANGSVEAPQARDDSPLSNNNTFIFNHWSDWTTPDSNGDGIVDDPYPRIVYSPQGSQGGWKIDPFPLAKPHAFPYSPPSNTSFTPTIIQGTLGTSTSTPFGPLALIVFSLPLAGVLRNRRQQKYNR